VVDTDTTGGQLTADYQLFHSDAVAGLKCVKNQSVNVVLTDPPYPGINRKYGNLKEDDWHTLMDAVVAETRRVLTPTGSAVFILQPNYKHIGEMRLWLWEFMVRTAKSWNLVQDAYWWNWNAIPLAGCNRKDGLLRSSVKYCLWFGPKDCYRNQDAVLWETAKFDTKRLEKRALYYAPSGRSMRDGNAFEAAVTRGGSTPFNLLPISNAGNRTSHGATTPLTLAEWWVRYLTKPDDIVLDPFSGAGTMGVAALNQGRHYIGFEKMAEYHQEAHQRLGTLVEPAAA
jgi:site-specific DNA-methyltransferase (cytosine-N4-specific)